MKKQILLSIITGLAVPAAAQPTDTLPAPQRHEASAYGTFGLATLSGNYTGLTRAGDAFNKPGGGVAYTFFFHPQWGVSVGAEVAFFNTVVQAATLKGSALETYTYGAATEPLHFNTEWTDYEETPRATYVHIPLTVQFRTAGYHKFYAALGGKLGFAVAGEHKTTATSLTTSGYLPESAQTFTDMPNHGFTTVRHLAATGAVDFGLNLSATAELGVRWALGAHLALYTGVYLDWGLSDVTPERTSGLVDYPSAVARDFRYHSVLTAQATPAGDVYADKLRLTALGVKVRLAMGW
jgi:hypothetical protein